MGTISHKRKNDELREEALKGTFPASDPPSSNESERVPVRPAHRRPPDIDPGLVEDLAQEAEAKVAQRRKRGRKT